MKQLTLFFFILVCLIQQSQAQCTEDCVWPGDLNANGIANHVDILALGLSFGETGPIRSDFSTNWEPLNADNWVGNLPILGTNFKHCDANASGNITTDDRFPIIDNFNLTNDNFSGLLGNNLEGNDLFIVPQNTVASPGESLIFDVHLGTAANPINDLYGIAFKIELDTQYINDISFDFSENWVGEGDNILNFDKYVFGLDGAYLATTRLDGTTISGFGKIAQLEIVITDVILGLIIDTTACLPFQINFKNVLAIDNEEGDLMVTAHGDSMILKHESQLTNTFDDFLLDDFEMQVFPNPATDILNIQTFDTSIEQIVLINSYGIVVLQQVIPYKEKNIRQINIPLQSFSSGIYFLEVQNGIKKVKRKIFIH